MWLLVSVTWTALASIGTDKVIIVSIIDVSFVVRT